jgi:DNA-binding LytR/AlgR family response regulator
VKSLRIYIVEDMGVTRASLINILSREGHTIAGSAATAEKAWLEIRALSIDVILMDFKLRGAKNGLWLTQRVRKLKDIPVIYLTAYGSKKIVNQIMDTQPDGYLMKPINTPTLLSTLEIAYSNYLKRQQAQQVTDEDQQVFVKTSTGMHQINIVSIHYLQSEGNYVHIHTSADKWTTRNKLDNIMQELALPSYFVRVHRRYIVNMKKISSVNSTSLKLGDQEIPMSRSFGNGFQQRFEKFQSEQSN